MNEFITFGKLLIRPKGLIGVLYQNGTLVLEERVKEMHRESIFDPAIDIPPEITIQCFEFDRWWDCTLKSETLCFEKGIVPKGSRILVHYEPTEGARKKAIFICTWLGERGWWSCPQKILKIGSISFLRRS